jgi:hypothetical protein
LLADPGQGVASQGHLQGIRAVFFAVADLLNLEVDLLFFDSPANRSAGSAGAVAG